MDLMLVSVRKKRERRWRAKRKRGRDNSKLVDSFAALVGVCVCGKSTQERERKLTQNWVTVFKSLYA